MTAKEFKDVSDFMKRPWPLVQEDPIEARIRDKLISKLIALAEECEKKEILELTFEREKDKYANKIKELWSKDGPELPEYALNRLDKIVGDIVYEAVYATTLKCANCGEPSSSKE